MVRDESFAESGHGTTDTMRAEDVGRDDDTRPGLLRIGKVAVRKVTGTNG